ncbi:MAG: hypothetical protein KGP28_02245 [Bdellovibrionales bacterium]|nr:hypothetical protein [Bdellovibrionales bacterium]
MNSRTLKKFIDIAAERLSGEWVVIGGTVLPILGIDHRVTLDIDFIRIHEKEGNADSLILMEIAEQMGLPVEAVNQAGAYFFSKVDHADDHLVILRKGGGCTIYRPDVWLYIALKLGRFTETDLGDCLVMIKHLDEEFQSQKADIIKLIQDKIKVSKSGHDEWLSRVRELLRKCQN